MSVWNFMRTFGLGSVVAACGTIALLGAYKILKEWLPW